MGDELFLKVIQYNILEGACEEPARLHGILSWLKQQDADVVTLNELNGWESHMASHAHEAGYDYATLHKTQGCSYHVGVMTRRPHEVLIRENRPFHFGLLGISCDGITFLITHLIPHSSEQRLGEARRIGQLAAAMPGPVLLVGDLNTLSPLDREEVEQPKALQILRSTPKLTRKFLNAEGQPDYRPMEKLTAAGLTDLGAGQSGSHTVPTAANNDSAHALPMRIDYMMGNDAFIKTWHYEIRVIRTPATDMLSDHYPVECKLTPRESNQRNEA